MKSLLSKITLLLALALPAGAVNIAGSGTGLLGSNDATITDAGTSHAQAGTVANIRDGNLTTRVDNYQTGQAANVNGYVGISWATARTDVVKSLTLTMACFPDGGWFGNRECPRSGYPLTADMLVPPVVQVSANLTTWTTVPATMDYVSAFTGHHIADNSTPTSRAFTITLPLWQTGMRGIRIIAPTGGYGDGNGFLGVFELAVEADAITDSEPDGMDDAWETANGLTVGVNDAALDNLDNDGLTNLREFHWNTNPQLPDSDGDTLNDGPEDATHGTFPNAGDTDGDTLSDSAEITTHLTSAVLTDTDSDGLSDAAEISMHFTLPLDRDTDNDGFSDGAEISLNTDPLSDTSRSANIARGGRAIMGRNTSSSAANLAVTGTPRANANSTAHLNDGDLYTRADTSGMTGTASHLGIVWDDVWPQPVKRLEITLATFGDGGWTGNAASAPAPGAALTATHITGAPVIQTTADGITWTTQPNGTFTTDYVARLTGHSTGGGARPIATRRSFIVTLNTPASGLRGIRIAGAHYIYLGAYEIAACDTTTTVTDTDGDGLSDADEATATTSLAYSDTDGDTASDGAEVNTLLSNPLVADTDGDFFPDGMEARYSTNPNDASSNPQNLSLLGGGTIGVKNTTTNAEVATANAGIPGNLVDGEPLTRVDSWNNTAAGNHSWIGARWATPVNVSAVQVQFAIFNHAGWFGPAGSGPAAGGALTAAHLTAPSIETSYDGGASWDSWPSTSNYVATLTGHLIALADNRPTRPPVVTFSLETPRMGITGIRLIGVEGGVTQPFVGAFEFAAVPGPPTPPDTTWHGVRGDTVTIAVTGDAVPGGGTFDRVEGASGNPVLTDSGEVMFLASVAGAPGSDRAIVRGSGGPLTTVARYGQLTPDGTNNHQFFYNPSYNNTGHLLFAGGEGSPSEQAVYRYSPGGNVELLHQSQPIPGGGANFAGFSLNTAPTTNAAGDFSFHASMGFSDGLFVTEGNTLHRIILQGENFDGGAWQSGGFVGPVNDAGTLVFGGSLNYFALSLRSAYFVRYWEPATGQFERKRIAREGDTVPEGNGLFGNFFHGLDPRITSAGQFAFGSTLTGTSGGNTDNEGLYRGRLEPGGGGELVPVVDPIARRGQPAPFGTGGGQLTGGSFLHPFINESGRIAFTAQLAGTGASTHSAIYSTTGGALTQLVRENMFAPDANGYPAGRFPSLFSEFGFNDAGQVAFSTLALRGVVHPTMGSVYGVFTTDGTEIISIARTGDAAEGSQIRRPSTGRRSLNRFGQVAYYTTLADGRNAVRLWTPDLHWTPAVGGSWDIGNNWTFGLNPAPMYRVVIGASAALTVTGPAANTGVKSLQIGGGYGAPVLLLQSNVTLTAAEGVTVAPNGTLAGNGTIAGALMSHGTLSPGASAGEITITGPASLTATSTYVVELGGVSPGLLDQVHITGDAAIAGALQVSMLGGYVLPPLQNYVIVTVGGTHTGTFAGLAEGAIVGTFGTRELFITYAGGDGNDIALFTGEDGGDPDADNDGLPDAWEIEKFTTITAQDADDDLDNDGSNALLEYGFDMNPNASDFPPAAVLEGNYLTLTITKRPLVTYAIHSGGALLDFSTADTTTLINDATTLKVRDNFLITGPAGRRFLQATVTAAP